MVEQIAFLIGLLLFLTVVSVIYWYVVRPVVLKAVLFRLFRKRDQLRWMAVSGEISTESQHYRSMQDTLCKIIAIAPSLNIFRFCFLSAAEKLRYKDSKLDENENQNEPVAITAMRKEAIEEMVLVLMINTPLLVSVASIAALVHGVSKAIRSASFSAKLRAIVPNLIKNKAEQFVDSMPLPA